MNRQRRHIATVLLMTGMALHLAAQSYVTPLTQDFVPPSPQSWMPVERQLPRPALMTGAAELSIPIYTVQVGDYSLPISLQYHSNGVKVLDDPCPLGYGWTLQPALRATRTILGRPDEHYPFYDDIMNASDLDIAAFQCISASHTISTGFPEKYDSQRDIITFALPDATVTQILKYDFENDTSTFTGIREAEYRISATAKLNEISVVDSKGIEYIYGAPYEYQPSKICKTGELRTAWALKEIRLGSRETIRFTWSLVHHDITSRKILGGRTYADLFDDPPMELRDSPDSDAVNDALFTTVGATDEFLHLQKIDFPGGYVEFKYSLGFVSEITVHNITEGVRTARLGYIQKDSKPYLLSEVSLSNEGVYSFDYHNCRYWSYDELHSQDWWGFYNAKNNTLYGLQPELKMFVRQYRSSDSGIWELFKGADRSVDTEAMKTNILTKVTYPTGGYSTFEYEPHSFPPMRDETGNEFIDEKYNPYLSYGGGLRVRKIESGDAAGELASSVTFSYSNPQVRAVPSAATFINCYQGIYCNYLHGYPIASRVVNISPFSNYMKDDMGCLPLWYGNVMEKRAEGYSLYEFHIPGNTLNVIEREFGRQHHQDLLNACGHGPVMTRRTVYKQMTGHTRAVEDEKWEYTTVMDPGATPSVDIRRKSVQISNKSAYSPDFYDGKYIQGFGVPFGPRPLEENPYELMLYSVVPYRDNLTTHTHTVYGDDGGAYTVTTEYTYLNQSALVSTVKTRGSRGETKLTTIDYPQAGRSWVEGQMVSRGMTGVPIKETVNEGGAVTVYEIEYGRTGGWTLIPVQMRTRFGSSADALEGPRFSHNSWGRPTGWADADGISELWLWGHFGRYPVWNVPGETYLSVYNNKKIRVDTQRADTIPASKVRGKFPLATEYRFKPLVGLSAVMTPAGIGSYYSYDAAGRLDSVRLNDRLLTSYKYNISQTGDNYVWASHEISTPRVEGELSSFSHDIKTTYDGLGRPVETRDYSTGIRSLREYDAMGRLWRESVASRNAPGEYDWTLYGYETSPRGVLTSTTKPGEAWHKGGKAATVRVLTNKTSGEYSLATYSFTGGGIARTGTYPAASLLIEESTDEDGHIVRKFTDKSGRTVATSEGASGQMLTTRYIYGDYGRLRYVLPPDIPDGTVTAATLAEKAYSYSYDSRGRLTESRVPGCAPARTRYSRAGRVVAEHPSAMAEGKWLLHFYDKFGREILTTIASPTEAQLQSLCDTLRTASYFGYNLHGGYKFDRALPCDFGEIQKAIYYDDYKFATRTDADYGFDTPPAVTEGEAPGLVTGECDYSEGPSAGRGTLYSYDGRGFVVEKWAMLPVGRQHTVYTYDDFGRVITETETLCRGTTPLIERETVNGYDSAGRLIRLSVTENGVTVRMSYGYNELGLLSKTVRGLDIQHLQEYDVHGWPTKSTISIPKTLPVFPGTIQPLSLSDTYYSGLILNPGGDVVAPEFQLPRKEYVEELFYAEGGAIPRFTGCPSARVTTLGSRYDYHFDVHDRLTRADYTPRVADSGEDFSARYIYDDLARPRRVVRWGVVNRTEDNAEEFGVLDDLIYTYDGGRLQSIAYDSEGMEYYGRPGYPGVTQGEYTWNDAGLMTSDSANGISLIDYNHFGLPVKTVAGRGATTCRYTVDGALATRTSRISGSKTSTTTTYSAGRMVTTDVLGNIESLYSYFPGGYFDKEGKIHYTFTDYQGSVIMVTDSDGNIEEQHGYYPYGEPWRTPEGQPLLYQGKERLATTGDHDFGARTLATPTLLWRQPDPMAHDYPGLSPYTFCAANPIRNIDPTGMDVWAMNSQGYVVGYYADDSLDMISIVNDKGEEIAHSQAYDYGTIKMHKKGAIKDPDGKQAEDKDGNKLEMVAFKINGDEAGEELFEFVSEHITESNGVEFSLTQIGEEETGANYLTTSHTERKEAGAGQLFRMELQFGYTIRTMTHSHPVGLAPSKSDLHFKMEVTKSLQGRTRIPAFKIYHSKTKQYINY